MSDYEDFVDLIKSAKFGRIDEMMEALDMGANINAKGCHSRTALIQAVRCRQKESVKFLLDHGADVTIKDDDGKTALDLATNETYGFPEVVELLKAAMD